ncbi:MAG: helix-turn-helix domain-containing protein [Actinobacteria bacterium]|nr:helix-turn-helix domain-containing protein [Actinomycetota bacterium]
MRDAPGTGWPAVPPRVAEQIRPLVPDLAEQMVAEISAAVTEYARLGDPVYASNLRLGAEAAIAGFADRIAWPQAPRQRLADTFYRIGKVEATEGRSLEMLQAALRTGARVVMHWLTGAAYHAIIPAETLGLLAEALLIHIDEIAAYSAAGHDQVQRRAAEETSRRRQRLITLLLADPAPAEAIAAQASLAGWRLPRLVSVMLLATDRAGGAELEWRLALPAEVLADLDRPQPCLIVPDPDGPGRRRMLDQALAGVRAAAGPAVPVTAAATSLAWAAETLALRPGGATGSHPVLHCDDHLTEIVLHRGHDALGRLGRVRLAPLSGVAAPRRKALADTLLTWLETRSIGQTADQLHIHRQTARYRMNQLRAMFGATLDDPDARFELELALRARRLA